MSRADRATTFLATAGWGGAARVPLAGDASRRRYERLTRADGARAVLMDAPPALGEDVRPFVAVARHLAGLGLSPPAILAADAAAGFLLLEDLGDALYSDVVAARPEAEAGLYAAAVDLLAALHRHPPPAGRPRYDAAAMADRARLAALWYATAATGRGDPRVGESADEIAAATLAAIAAHAPETPVLALRDYHAQNLVWLPERTGTARVGLLDFQDAAAGHPAYDLVSLLEDARRDVPPILRAEMIARYAVAADHDTDALAAACAVLGAQRALRILGVFARLSLRDDKPGYVALIPRVWAHLDCDLGHPACADLRAAVALHLPEPSAEHLARLRAGAGTVAADPAPAAP